MGPGSDGFLKATDRFGTRIGRVVRGQRIGLGPGSDGLLEATDPFGTRIGRVVRGNGSVWDQDRTGSQQAHTTETDPVSEP